MVSSMGILVINGDCIQTNTSANLCHLAYIRGLVDSGHNVTLLSADGKDYQLDDSMKIPNGVESHTYYAVSFYEKLSLKKRNSMSNVGTVATADNKDNHINLKTKLVRWAKNTVLKSYGVHGIYAKFVKKAKKFKSDTMFDYVLSISTPVTSHLLAHKLIKSGNVKCKKWIQIWEDPWYSDVYGFNGKDKIYKEEKKLLSFAERVCYVSPLTLKNQQRIFSESAHKMYWQPLPYYYKDEENISNDCLVNYYGYFGAYYPAARDLAPFYQAARNTNINVNICGSPCNLFASTEKVYIHPRLPLAELKPIEDKTNVLIFLCNRKGGQIPGKIYQYSATNKTILFILDGTEEEKKVLREFFEPFNRYVFCENTVEDITRAIKLIENKEFGNIKNVPLEEFNPKITIKKILEG